VLSGQGTGLRVFWFSASFLLVLSFLLGGAWGIPVLQIRKESVNLTDIDSDLLPSLDNTYDIGSASLGFANLYLKGRFNLSTTNSGVALSIQGGSAGTRDLANFYNANGNLIASIFYDGGQDGVIDLLTNAGVNTVRIQTSGDTYFKGGNVGIGTTSPAQELHVVGDARITNNLELYGTTDQKLTLLATDDSWAYMGFNNSTNRLFWMGLDATGNFRIVADSVAGDKRLYLRASSNYIDSSNNLVISGSITSGSDVITSDGGVVRARSAGNDKRVELYHNDANAVLDAVNGELFLIGERDINLYTDSPGTEHVRVRGGTHFLVYDGSNLNYAEVYHDGTHGYVTTSSGDLRFTPAGQVNLTPGLGTVYVTGNLSVSGSTSLTDYDMTGETFMIDSDNSATDAVTLHFGGATNSFGLISTEVGDLRLSPAGGDVIVTGSNNLGVGGDLDVGGVITGGYGEKVKLGTGVIGTCYLVGSLPYSSASVYEKLKISVFGGNWYSSNLGEVTYYASSREGLKINREVHGGGVSKFELKVFNDTSNSEYDFVINVTSDYPDFVVRAWKLGSADGLEELSITSCDVTGMTEVTPSITTIIASDNDGNVGIGTTSPGALLHVSSSEDTFVRITSGSSDWAGVEFTGVGNTWKLERDTDGMLRFTELGVGYPIVIQNGTGNVGINVISPVSRLQVGGNLTVYNPSGGLLIDSDGNAELHIGEQLAAGGTSGEVYRLAIQPYGHTGGPWNFVARDTSDAAFIDVRYGTGGTLFTIKHNGNVGVGTTAPETDLDVRGDILIRDVSPSLTLDDTSNSYGGWIDFQNSSVSKWQIKLASTGSGDNLDFLNSASNIKVTITQDGYVGIGASDPSSELDIDDGGGYGGTPQIEFNDRVSMGYDGGRTAAFIRGASGKHIVFDTNGANERMRITSEGYVGIGKTDPVAALDVNGAVRFAGGITLSGADDKIYFDADHTTYMYRESSTGDLIIHLGG